MRKYLVIALLPLFLYACAETNYWGNDLRVEDSETKTFSASNIQRVEINTKNGAIETRAWNDDSIHITFEKWATGDDVEEAEDNLDDIEILVDRNSSSGVLDIDVRRSILPGVNHGCNVFVNLPTSIALDLETTNGAIVVLNSENDLECSTSNGVITIQDTKGDAELRTSNGIITVDNHHGNLNARTSNGVISADVVLPRQGDCILKTSNGPITLSVPDSSSAMVEASTSNGKIEIHDLSVSVIKMEKAEFKGKMGSGRGNIDLQTSNGRILITSGS
ncbi:DUF4097 domain-containing protein [Candidatus Poribacteria bacterium]